MKVRWLLRPSSREKRSMTVSCPEASTCNTSHMAVGDSPVRMPISGSWVSTWKSTAKRNTPAWVV